MVQHHLLYATTLFDTFVILMTDYPILVGTARVYLPVHFVACLKPLIGELANGTMFLHNTDGVVCHMMDVRSYISSSVGDAKLLPPSTTQHSVSLNVSISWVHLCCNVSKSQSLCSRENKPSASKSINQPTNPTNEPPFHAFSAFLIQPRMDFEDSSPTVASPLSVHFDRLSNTGTFSQKVSQSTVWWCLYWT